MFFLNQNFYNFNQLALSRVVAEGKSLIPLSDVHLLPPVSSPDKIVCVGLNYRGHCEEQKRPFPQEPIFFSKWSSCIIGPNAEIKHPSITNVTNQKYIFVASVSWCKDALTNLVKGLGVITKFY